MKKFESTRNGLACEFYPMALATTVAQLVPTGVTDKKPVAVFISEVEKVNAMTIEGFAYTLDATGAPSVTVTLGAAGTLLCVVCVMYQR